MPTSNRPAVRGARAAAFFSCVLLAGCDTQSTVDAATTKASSPAPLTPVLATPAPAELHYDRDVRPLLSDRCFKCHGPDDKKRAVNRRLDTADGATAERKGKQAIVPGNLAKSDAWRRIESTDPEEVMPPADSGKKPLTAAEKQLLKQWIEQGAAYEPHWSFVPPQRSEVPAATAASGEHPVDRFLAASLAKQGLTFSAEADRDTLCRRTFLAFTGLPPTPQELDAFAADTAPDAHSKLVHKLLHEEPYRSRFAEHFGTPWLDAARYADTCGIHMDAGRQIWPWRDWALSALRDGMPFDRFVTEQIAGDLLPNATIEQQVASGFQRNHVTTDEGGAIAAEYLVEYAADRTATTGSVLLGLTLNCARCHEHKYDPISHDDYYRMFAFYNSIEEPGLYSQEGDPQRAFEPNLVVPSQELAAQRTKLQGELTTAKSDLERDDPAAASEREHFVADTLARAGVHWATTTTTAAQSTEGATLAIRGDGSVLASGKNPAKDDHVLTLRTDAQDLRLLCLHALTDPSLPMGSVGRAPNGNVVLTSVLAEATSIADPQQHQAIEFTWAWSDREQTDGNYRVVNILNDSDELGWAVGAHQAKGDRTALLLAKAPFGYAGGTEVKVTLRYRSIYAEHTFGCVRLTLGSIGEAGLALLPEAQSGFFVDGPHAAASGVEAFDKSYAAETLTALVTGKNGTGTSFRYNQNLRDAVPEALSDGIAATYVARTVFAPSPRPTTLSLGSDDGFRLYVNSVEAAQNRTDRAVAADQDQATAPLVAGSNLVVLKVVNTGGAGGFYWRRVPRPDELDGDLVAALLPASTQDAARTARLHAAWRSKFSPGYREQKARIDLLTQQLAELEQKTPRTMVMREREKPRDTYVLLRGQYDKPDKTRKVTPMIPAALGKLPEGAPQNRLGLAQWLTSADNPLVARVAVNRLWEFLFGAGIVRTSEDFGMQGEYPSHRELIDWLAVEFREGGYDQKHMLELIATSRAFRQAANVVPAAKERDPDNRLLAYWPRRRLSAEAIRDQALYTSGLLVEHFGGPSVKPYQPEGLWQEVAMVQSNTRVYQRGMGDDLFRRSLYTYWKRACPPPSLLLFDAPTREFCTVRRLTTNTPLQALVLWNDEQFVEAARALAIRTMTETGDDRARLHSLLRRCSGEAGDAATLDRLQQALTTFRARYQDAAAEASQLLAVGTVPLPANQDPRELAAWTLLASAVLDLDTTLCIP